MENNDKIYWDQRTHQNDLRIMMAVIHYALGNIDITRKQLDVLSEYGWVHMPDGSLDLLGYSKTEDFFNAIYGDNGENYRQLEWSIKLHNDQAWDDSGWNPLDASQNPYPY
mgnify:CR=1 FL=1